MTDSLAVSKKEMVRSADNLTDSHMEIHAKAISFETTCLVSQH